MFCPICGSDGVSVWYNKIIELSFEGQREKIIYCDWCKTTTAKRETRI